MAGWPKTTGECHGTGQGGEDPEKRKKDREEKKRKEKKGRINGSRGAAFNQDKIRSMLDDEGNRTSAVVGDRRRVQGVQFPTNVPLTEISRDRTPSGSCWSEPKANEVGSVNKLYTTVIAQRDTRREYVEGLGPRAFVYVSRRSRTIPSIRGEEREFESSRAVITDVIIILIEIGVQIDRCKMRSNLITERVKIAIVETEIPSCLSLPWSRRGRERFRMVSRW